MTRTSNAMLMAAACALALPASAQDPDTKGRAPGAVQQTVPDWVRRGIPGAGHAALAPLVGTWRVHKSIYGTMGRSPDLPPIVSDDVITKREWVADGHYIQDTTEGVVDGQPYWRRGWLGYSNMDRRHEWVTIDPLNTTMMSYLGKPGSGEKLPIEMTGVFTDQGVVSERTVGKRVGQRTVIRMENDDRHVFELYFTPPGEREQLADRSVYTRIEGPATRRSSPAHGTASSQRGIALPDIPDPAPGETGPYCVIAKHRAKPGRADAYERRMLADLEYTRAEPGLLQFHIHRDRFDRNLLVIYEVWRDAKALREHFEKPYVKQFVIDSAEYIEGDMEVQWIVMASPYAEGKPK